MKKIATQNQTDMKLTNMLTIFDILYDHSPLSRADLAKISGMSPTSITRFISELSTENLIVERRSDAKKVGRAATLLEINKDAFYSIGINIDSNFLHVSIMDFTKSLVSDQFIKLSSINRTVDGVLNSAYNLFQTSMRALHLNIEQIIGIGISIIGVIDDDDFLSFIPQLKWRGINLKKCFQEKFGIENVMIDNDCNCALVGESVKCPKYKQKSVACICLGSGVGSAFYMNGQLFSPNGHNSISEIGHTVVDPNGMICDCGNIGCLQTFIAEQALIDRAQLFDSSISSLDDIHSAWIQRIDWAVSLIHTACLYTKIAINNIACVYNPDIILVGGDTIDTYWDMFQEVIDHNQLFFEPLKHKVQVTAFFKKYQSSILGITQQVHKSYITKLMKKIVLT